jgi:hypothetical protein
MAPFPTDIWKEYTTAAGSGTSTPHKITVGGTEREYWQLFCNGRTLNYAKTSFGTQPSTGFPLYICFCGGGTSWSSIPNDNDTSCWFVFEDWYGIPVKKQEPCVLVAPRGISLLDGSLVDTYDLHSQPESYVLLQRLIMNLTLPNPAEFKGTASTAPTFIDPNKVYLLGFSAGGNGVYQLSTKISDRCAAVVAGGGHPEGASFENLANLPIRIQVGGADRYDNGVDPTTTFPRPAPNLAVDEKLEGLKCFYKDHTLYQHKTDIVRGGNHGRWAQSSQVDQPQPVLDKPMDYLSAGSWNPSESSSPDFTTTIIAPGPWVATLHRDPTPSTVVWNLNSRPPTLGKKGPTPAPNGKDEPYQPQNLFYWLCIRDATSKDFSPMDTVHASWGKNDTENWIKIQKPAAYLGFLVNEDMADFSKPLIVYDWNNARLGTTSLGKISTTLMRETLRARGDPTMVFSKMVYLQSAGGTSWFVKTADSLLPSALPRL